MKKIISILLVTALLLASTSLVMAEEGAKYNLASVQSGKQISVTPGGEGRGVIYFYNIDGNRITHITLSVSQAPDNLEVEIQPPLHDTQVKIGDQVLTVTENLYVKPSEALPEEISDVPEGMVCIKIPGRGYVLAQPVNVIVRAPESAEVGTGGDVHISALAEWLGQSGAAAIKQARDFDFSVRVISGNTDTTETIVGEKEKPGVAETPAPSPPTTQPAPASEGSQTEAAGPVQPPASESASPVTSATNWLPTIIAGIVVVLGAVFIPRLISRKRG